MQCTFTPQGGRLVVTLPKSCNATFDQQMVIPPELIMTILDRLMVATTESN